MNNTENNIENVKNAISLISGAYTLPLIDKLFPDNQKVSGMEDIYLALVVLTDADRNNEAFHMIRGLFGIAEMKYPKEIVQLEKVEELRKTFVSEFILDFYDVIVGKR